MVNQIGPDPGLVSDGFHTFNELYEHRHALFIALSKHIDTSWRSIKHDDGSMYEGWFIAGIDLDGESITYHLPVRVWDKLNHVATLERAPKWDGHTSDDVVRRLYEYRT